MGLYNSTDAQNVSVNVNINLNKQPAWGPEGYDYAGFYYFPDLNIYFDVNHSLFYYQNNSKWIGSQYLPDKYRKYDLYSLYKIVINDSQPWNNNKTHKKNYSNYKGDRTQTPIRYSTDSRYSTSKGNSNVWVNTNRNDNRSTNSTNNNRGNSTSANNNNRGNTQTDKNNTQSDRNTQTDRNNSGRQSSSNRR